MLWEKQHARFRIFCRGEAAGFGPGDPGLCKRPCRIREALGERDEKSVRIKGRFLLLCLILVSLAAGGCSSGEEEREPSGEKVLRYVNYSPAGEEGIDLLHLKSSAEQTIACYLTEGLMRVYQYEISYGVADSYKISEDGCTYTFHLREDACYSDGEPVRAADFLRAFRRLMEKENYHSRMAVIKNAEEIYQGNLDIEKLGVWAVDEQTLKIELEHPMAHFLQLLALRAFAPIREDAGAVLRRKDCNGPFMLGSSEEETVFSMDKNPCYWGREHISLDGVEAVYLPDIGTAYEKFQKGEVDVMPIPTDGTEAFLGGEQRRVMTGIYENLYLDLETPGPLQCRELRQALHFALDRVEYRDALNSTSIEPNARYIPAMGLGICQTYIERYPDLEPSVQGDEEQAARYLEQALEKLGYSKPEEITFSIGVHEDDWSKREAEEIKRQWEEKLGICVSVKILSTSALYSRQAEGGMILTGMIAEYSDIMAYLEGWDYDYASGTEGSRYGEFHEYLKQAERQTDPQIRLNTLYRAEEILMEDVPMIPLQLRADRLLISPELTGFETSTNLAGGGYEFLYADFK